MDERCRATKANGERCKAPVSEPDGYCWAHSPKHAEHRKRITSKAGRGRRRTTASAVDAVLGELDEVVKLVRSRQIESKDGAVISQLLNTKLRGLELRMRAVEHEEWSSKLTEIEAWAEEVRSGSLR